METDCSSISMPVLSSAGSQSGKSERNRREDIFKARDCIDGTSLSKGAMLTRRENLLIRPWQERRYIQHRKKVKAALPAIDNTPPPFRKHVSYKLKKIQKETERCTQIISDNFTLLQHLSNIMTTTRVDHFWEEPPPNFLQRVGIYMTKDRAHDEVDKDEAEEVLPAKSRKEKCQACSPERFRQQVTYDVRRPYTPPKERISRKPEPLPDWDSQFKSRCDEDRLEFRGKVWKSPGDGREKKKKKPPVVRRLTSSGSNETMEPDSQSIVLDRGGLRVAVKFPTHTDVVFNSPTETKVIKKHFCECKSFPRPRKKDNASPSNMKPGSG